MHQEESAIYNLSRGSHDTFEEGHCLLEVVAHLAGEPHTDHPTCACPVISAAGRRLNDEILSDERRNVSLGGLAPMIVGTKDASQERTRSLEWLDWIIRVSLPAWLELSPDLRSHAAKLRAMPMVSSQNMADFEQPVDAAWGVPRGLPRGLPWRLPRGLPWGLPRGMPRGLPWGMPWGLPRGLPRERFYRRQSLSCKSRLSSCCADNASQPRTEEKADMDIITKTITKTPLVSLHDLDPGTVFEFVNEKLRATVVAPECIPAVAVTGWVDENGWLDTASTDAVTMVRVLRRPGDPVSVTTSTSTAWWECCACGVLAQDHAECAAGTKGTCCFCGAQAEVVSLETSSRTEPSHAHGDQPRLQEMLEIAKVAMEFADVERTTMHPDGRFESDTTHTVMLALATAECSSRLGMNVAKSVAFAMVHDLAEVYAGDTCTARGLSDEQKADKAERERLATDKLHEQLGPNSEVLRWLSAYERQDEPESRLVRYLDKVLPKLTHILNNGKALLAIGMTTTDAANKHELQQRELAKQYPELVESIGLLLVDAALAAEDALARALHERGGTA